MKSFRLFLLFTLFSASLFSQKIIVNWEGKKEFDYGNQTKKTFPYFSNEQYSLVNDIPYIIASQKNISKNELEIKHLIWEKIDAKDLLDINVNSIPTKEIFYVNRNYDYKEQQNIDLFSVSVLKKDKKAFYRLASFEIVPSDKKKSTLSKRINIGTTENPLKSGEFFKIKVDKSGIFKITTKFLRDNGINPANINPQNFRIYGNGGVMLPEYNQDFRYNALQENAIEVIGENDGKWDEADYALFYAQGPHGYNLYNNNNGSGHKRVESRSDNPEHHYNIYEDYSYYYINFDKGAGKRVENSDIAVPTQIYNRFDDYQFINEHKNNFNKIGRLWVGEPFNNNKTISFKTNSAIQATDIIKYRTVVYSRNGVNNEITVNINGSNSSTAKSSVDISSSYFYDEVTNITGNSIDFNYIPNTAPNPNGSFYIDYAEIQYKQDLSYNNSQMNFRVFEIEEGSNNSYGFSVNNTTGLEKIWDVSDITNAKNKINKSSASNVFSFGYVADSPYFNNEFIAFKASSAYDPLFVEKVKNQDLSSLSGVDYLIITTEDYKPHAERLANYHRTKNNYKVEVVDTKTIYNEYSSGGQDITAIRDFTTHLNQPIGTLKYVFILGDTTFDFKNISTSNKNYVPSYQSEFSLDFVGSYVTDDYFVMNAPQSSSFLPAIIPDLPVGRLTAENTTEAKLLIDKTLAYYNALPGQSTPFGDWRMKLNFVVDDDQDNRNDTDPNIYMRNTFHHAMNLALAANFEGSTDKPEYNIKKLYFDAFPAENTSGGQRFPQVNQGIFNSMSNSLYLYYFGHGGINGWGQERVLTSQDVINNNNFNSIYSRFPLVSTITCEFTLWDDHTTSSTGEQMLKIPQGGSNAMITSSRAISVDYGRKFTEIFTRNIFKLVNDDFLSIGESFLNARKEYGANSNHLKVNLLADPALKLSRPKKLLIVDQVQSPISGQLRALDFVKITGHINKADGTTDTSFNGKVALTIFDKKLTKKTLNNDGNLTPVLTYIEEGSPIVKASGTATNGIFTVEFYMPKDINYTVGSGRMLTYADNNVYDVFSNQNLQIGDINPNGINDNEAPKVQLYLNNTNFVNGGITNSSPNLLACVTDNTGINSTGAGIGHDITVYLDGEIINTKVLNDFYNSGSGNGCINASFLDYQKGNVVYPFQNLKPGEHTLTFKVWDINNNSTTETLNFIVKDESAENLVINKLLNWPNPFTNKTYIQFEHNCDDILDVTVQIFTITGKLVRSFSTVVSSNPFLEGYRTNRTAIEWDGNDDYGNAVGKGTYIYKVLVKSQDQEKCKGSASNVEKLVILK